MVSVGDNVEVTEYNDYVARVNLILGIGSGKKGYGVAMATTGQAVAGTTDITAAQWAGLRTDINLIYSHQTNTTTSIGEIITGNIIGADESNVGTGDTVLRDNATDTFTIVNPDVNKGVNDFGPTIPAIEVDPETVHPPHLSVESKITPATPGASYTSSWNGTLTAEVLVTFAGAYTCKANDGSSVTATNDDHRRHFFNTGGEIRFSSAMVNGTGTKSADWITMLTNAGTITIDNSSTTTTGTATVSSTFGNEDLTTTYQQVARKYGSDVLYAENNWLVEAKLDGSGNIIFKFSWIDADTGDPGTDELVDGDVNLTMSQVRCTGPITILDPVYTFQQNIQ